MKLYICRLLASLAYSATLKAVPKTYLLARLESRIVTVRASQRSPSSMAGSMPRPQPWGSPAWTHCLRGMTLEGTPWR